MVSAVLTRSVVLSPSSHSMPHNAYRRVNLRPNLFILALSTRYPGHGHFVGRFIAFPPMRRLELTCVNVYSFIHSWPVFLRSRGRSRFSERLRDLLPNLFPICEVGAELPRTSESGCAPAGASSLPPKILRSSLSSIQSTSTFTI
jgi:hypothetical protein